MDLSRFEKRVYSQNGEDGVISQILRCIGEKSRYYVEFGAGDGNECNTRLLREKGWQGLLLDASFEDPKIHLHKEKVTAKNIQKIFAKYSVPKEFDLLSIDIDYNDFYVWRALFDYSPLVVVIEYNASHGPNFDRIVLYDSDAHWDGTVYHGASILSLYRLGKAKGYSLVYAEKSGVNLFFIRDTELRNRFKNMNEVQKLYQFPAYGNGPLGGHPEDLKKRKYCSTQDLASQR